MTYQNYRACRAKKWAQRERTYTLHPTCPLHPEKVWFVSKRRARDTAKQRDMRVYKCPGCHRWHLTTNLARTLQE